jgi:UDPglucose 6-dehydrogenase
MKTRYSIIGLGKLGASMAAGIASRGFDVIGVDVNENAVRLVNDGHAPVQETGLEDFIAANKKRLKATMSHREAVLGSDVSFVIVPTPSDQEGAFSLQYAAWAFQEIGAALKEKDDYHVVVMTSTVLPGATRYGLLPVLEKASGKKCGPDFGLCYMPEFIALGSVIRDFLNPDFTLLGEFDDRCGEKLEKCFEEILESPAPCMRMSLENAELTKLCVNTYVTTKIAFANMLAEICETIPGGNVDVVSDALGQDKRIGRRYLTGALGYGGPCFPRDNVALSWFARTRGVAAALAETTDKTNRTLAGRIESKLTDKFSRGETVAILGLSYKPMSHIVEVVGYDPLANDMARSELGDKAVIVDSIEDCVADADCILVCNPDPEFKSLTPEMVLGDKGSVTVVDFWRFLRSSLEGHPGIDYRPYGTSADDDANAEAMKELWGGNA